MIEKISQKKCTGCKMCEDLCPNEAITFHEDKEGFWYPNVDPKKCDSCGLCIKQCIAILPFASEQYSFPSVYSLWLKDIKMRRYSTSGGAYYALAREIFNQKGLIIACSFTADWKRAMHIVVDSEEKLIKTVTSKYFQSDTKGIYKSTREALEYGKQVLFCGTPCQSAALQRFLGKRYNNLITMDFICRGINSPKAYQSFISELEEMYSSPVKRIHFKNKREGWGSLGILVEFKNGREHFETRENSNWTSGYIIDNLYMRPSCYNCQYRRIPRCSDFTVGDFWGIQNINPQEFEHGISVVFTNNERADIFLKNLKTIKFEKHTFEEALLGNPCILHSPEEGVHRKDFFVLLDKMRFSDAVSSCRNQANK